MQASVGAFPLAGAWSAHTHTPATYSSASNITVQGGTNISNTWMDKLRGGTT